MPSKEDAIQIGIKHVEHEDNQLDEGTDNQPHGDSQDQQQLGIGRSIRPGAPCPETILVAVMTDGSYLLVGYPRGELTTFIAAQDAGSLREALAEAFGHSTDEVVSRNGNGIPEHEPRSTEQAQS